jgi:hypothetical protein
MKVLSRILFGALAVASFASCKKNNQWVDKDAKAAPEYSQFALSTFTGSYFIENSATSEYKIPVGFTTVSNADRTIQFSYKSFKAVQGTQYTAPASMTIKAGQALDTLRIKGLFAGYATPGRKDTVVIKISGGSAPAFSGKDSVVLYLQKYCPVVQADITGLFNNTREYTSAGAFSYGPYTTAVSNFTSTGTTTATVQFENLYDDGWNNINATLDWTNPANFTVTIASQATGKSYSGAPTNVRSTTGRTNTFSSCDQSYNFFVDLVNGSTVISSAYNFRLAR